MKIKGFSEIKVEKINGPIMLMSASQDEVIPSTAMSVKIAARLKAKKFRHHYEHHVIEGSHAESLSRPTPELATGHPRNGPVRTAEVISAGKAFLINAFMTVDTCSERASA